MQKTISPEDELKVMAGIVEAMTVAESAGVLLNGGPALYTAGRYSIEWDSITARWTLVSETDDAIDVCSFNQRREECREGDLCEQCTQNLERLEEEEVRAGRY
jgi:hypothetical protein